MLRVAGVLLAIAFYLYCIIDVIRTPKLEARTLPKFVWLIIVVVLPILGGFFWLLFGRVWPAGGFRGKRNIPQAPDDDPKFLRKLDDAVWGNKMKRRREQNP